MNEGIAGRGKIPPSRVVPRDLRNRFSKNAQTHFLLIWRRGSDTVDNRVFRLAVGSCPMQEHCPMSTLHCVNTTARVNIAGAVLVLFQVLRHRCVQQNVSKVPHILKERWREAERPDSVRGS